jgi:hypothetical protein
VAHLEAQVPQQIEHGLDHLLAVGGQLVGQQEQEVHIGMGRQLAAPVAAHRHQGQALGVGGVGHGIEVLEHMVVDHPDQLVHQMALGAHRQAAGRARFEAPAHLGHPCRKAVLQDRHHPAPALGLGQVRGDDRLEFRLERAPVDDGAPVAHHRLSGLGLAGRARRVHGFTMPRRQC